MGEPYAFIRDTADDLILVAAQIDNTVVELVEGKITVK